MTTLKLKLSFASKVENKVPYTTIVGIDELIAETNQTKNTTLDKPTLMHFLARELNTSTNAANDSLMGHHVASTLLDKISQYINELVEYQQWVETHPAKISALTPDRMDDYWDKQLLEEELGEEV